MTTPSKTTQKRAAAQSAPAASKRASAKTAKPAPKAPHKHEKMVRDSFTIPKSEYAVLGTLKQRTNGLARPAKKSELLRAGIKALASMGDAALLGALKGVPTIKTGRPAAKAAPTPKVPKAKEAVSDKH